MRKGRRTGCERSKEEIREVTQNRKYEGVNLFAKEVQKILRKKMNAIYTNI